MLVCLFIPNLMNDNIVLQEALTLHRFMLDNLIILNISWAARGCKGATRFPEQPPYLEVELELQDSDQTALDLLWVELQAHLAEHKSGLVLLPVLN